jgi:ribosome biogenesis GTPase
MRVGTITKSTGKYYIIKDHEDGATHTGMIRGKFKLDGYKLTNPVGVGDEVQFSIEGEYAMIQKIANRENYVVRQSPRKKHFMHLLAANIDQALLVVTVVEPKLKQGFIDRFLLMTEPYNIPVIIVFNKADLWEKEDQMIFDYLHDIYTPIGYQIIATSTISGIGISELQASLSGKRTLCAGQSGVGKSSLLNTLAPDLELRTQDLSDYSGKGQHTTTFAEMFDLDDKTELIDTPGIKSLAFNHLEEMDIAHNFRELFSYSKDCKFSDCTHRNEPNCAVKAAVESEDISTLRYENYLQLIDEIENQNYWERITDY